MIKKFLVMLGILFYLSSTSIFAQEGELGDETWSVDERTGRYFYLTHGTAVWGHEFGFFKDPNDCDVDTLWLTFSSSEEKVKDFIGKDVVISLAVDGKNFRVRTPMLSAGTIGFTHVMTFTNLTADSQLTSALMKGRYAKVMILEPHELEALLDIKEDQFGLDGFAASRMEATQVCQENTPSLEQKEADQALLTRVLP